MAPPGSNGVGVSSLGLALVPTAIMTLGALLISDTPSNLVERGKIEQAKRYSAKVHEKDTNTEAKLADLIKSNEIAKTINQEPFLTIFERQYRSYLVISVAIPFFQQVTGINIITFYAPVLFQSVGFGSDSALIEAIILGLANLCSVLVSTAIVDRFGRKLLFIEGGIFTWRLAKIASHKYKDSIICQPFPFVILCIKPAA